MTKLVGILNITPDSFSDGGEFFSPNEAISRAKKMVEEGASIIDIGAESTRPGAKLLSHEEEWERLHQIIHLIRKELPDITLSLDTRHVETLEKSLEYGINWINDVSGFSDYKMLPLLQSHKNLKLVLMHSMSVPADPQITINSDPVREVLEWAQKKMEWLQKNYIDRERIIFDPGIGFGKTKGQSLELIKNMSQFNKLKTKIMVGHSRKSFLTLFTNKPAEDRDIETIAVTAYLTLLNIDFLRVHDVAKNMQVVKVMQGLTS